MTFWEFLLQKDGDRSWLPLESPTVEILEGRYRVVGRSSRINTPLEIRIVHDALTDSAPPRRTQKRSGCTNEDGLVVIMPFTELQPGDWELYCTADIMADMMGEGWQYGVKLQVLSVVEDAEAWEPELQEAAHLPTLSVGLAHAAALPSSLPAIPLIAVPEKPIETPSLQPAVSFVAEETKQPALAESPPLEPDEFAPHIPEAIRVEALPLLKLQLEQEMYVVQRGDALLLRGEIRSANTDEELPLQVRVKLYAPQNSQVLFDLVYPLGRAALPLPFDCTVPLPHHYETYLILGEAIVELTSVEGIKAITGQSFKVTTDLHELLESIADSFNDLPDVIPPLESTSLRSELPSFTQPEVPPTVHFQPAQTILPPQLRPPAPEDGEGIKDRRTIELPSFTQTEAASQAAVSEVSPQEASFQEAVVQEPLQETESALEGEADSGQSADASSISDPLSLPDRFFVELPGTIDPDIGVAKRDVEPVPKDSASKSSQNSASETAPPPNKASARFPQSGTNIPSSQSSRSIIDDSDPALDWQHADLQQPRKRAAQSPLAPEDIAFRSLNLQQRFLSRLQSLASDSQLSAALQSEQPSTAKPQKPNSSESAIVSVFNSSPSQPIGQDAHLALDEFVIDEGWEDMAALQQRTTPQKPWQTAAQPPAPGLTLSPDEPLPVPILHLPSENLMSGSSALVLVKLPDSPAKLAVKLWLIDRQSRLLLDGPHWLTDFTPDGFGQWMSRIELFLPQGYLEVQIEAISVEIMTQRESEKTVEARSIDPLSQLPYDPLDL